jgi:peptide deformylase
VILNFQINEKEWRPIALVNPMLIDASIATEIAEEGCLSLPGIFGPVTRHLEVTVQFADESGGERVLQLAGLNARAAQHEIDHLDGVLFIDRIEKGTHCPNPVAL